MSILKHECHLHLYGCLSAKDLHIDSRDRSERYAARFQWFLTEYKKSTSHTIDPKLWWEGSDGYGIFCEQFLCRKQTPFEIFQAKFNLLIALYPPTADDMTLPKAVFAEHQKTGGWKEYRTFLPLTLTAEERVRYLGTVIQTAKDHETASYHPRLAISFSRQDADAWESYRFLIDVLENHPALAPYITGIDFCASERGHPPSAKKALFAKINEDNKTRKQPLQILYHVGEMWQDIALHSATRWCVEAAQIGTHRLGHALALGMSSESLAGRTITESKTETAAHFAWLRRHRQALQENGFSPADYSQLINLAEKNTAGDKVTWHYTEQLIDQTTNFQRSALAIVRGINPVVESCPTSNVRIGDLKKASYHPLRRFLDHQLRVAISTDDPGIFDITLDGEARVAESMMGVSPAELVESDRLTETILQVHS
jgi:hypothetical protein